MKTEIDLRTNIAVIDGTPEEIAQTLHRLNNSAGVNISENIVPAAKIKSTPRLFHVDEDDQLIKMKNNGASWPEIGRALNRSGSSVRARYAILKKREASKPQAITIDNGLVGVQMFGEEFEGKAKPQKPESAEDKSEKDRPVKQLKRPEWAKGKNIKRSYSDDESRQIVELYNAGKTDAQIGQALGRTPVAITNRILIMRKAGKLGKRPPLADHKRGGNRRGGKPKAAPNQKSNVSFSLDENRQIRQLHKDGESPAQIAKLIGRDTIEVMAQINNLGLE